MILFGAALHDGHYKYIRYLQPGVPEELYDLKSDPEELTNLAQDTKQRQTLDRLRRSTVEELHRTEATYIDDLPQLPTD